MKKLFKNLRFYFPIFLLLTSCEIVDNLEDNVFSDKDDRESLDQAVAVPAAELLGAWEVFRLIDEGEDETYEMDGMIIDFSSSDEVTANLNGRTEAGTWRLVSNNRELILRFATSLEPFEDLDDEWYIREFSNDEMHLHDPGSKGGEWLYLRRKN